jgi:RNase P protein component
MAPSFRCRSVSKKRERGEERRPNGEIKNANTRAKMHRFVGAAIRVLAKELPNYRFFFLAKIAFQLSL